MCSRSSPATPSAASWRTILTVRAYQKVIPHDSCLQPQRRFKKNNARVQPASWHRRGRSGALRWPSPSNRPSYQGAGGMCTPLSSKAGKQSFVFRKYNQRPFACLAQSGRATGCGDESICSGIRGRCSAHAFAVIFRCQQAAALCVRRTRTERRPHGHTARLACEQLRRHVVNSCWSRTFL